MTDPRRLGGRLLFPASDCARCFPCGLEETDVWVALSFLVVVLLRWSEGREVEMFAF